MVKCDNCGAKDAQNPIHFTNCNETEILCDDCYNDWCGDLKTTEPEKPEKVWSVS